ncbi:hypothetical protein LTR02_017653 [Friedmanniomyces endolithicus]|nr:hypothetical protein LTR02_017653 [Friedmanniomyces endolithicus]KAK0894597.1 hypothetical protein LTR57_023435 [Friedmanniomyces endolithicus]KAK0952601.1 hypothetical protein LTS01_024755 [Friedmanniomyces endolithicus]
MSEILTHLTEPTVDTAAESECEAVLKDIVDGAVSPIRAASHGLVTHAGHRNVVENTNVVLQKRKRNGSDHSLPEKRVDVRLRLHKQDEEGDTSCEGHLETLEQQHDDADAQGKESLTKRLRLQRLNTDTAGAGGTAEATLLPTGTTDALVPTEPPRAVALDSAQVHFARKNQRRVSETPLSEGKIGPTYGATGSVAAAPHAGRTLPDQDISQSQIEQQGGAESTALAIFRLEVESLVGTLPFESPICINVSQANELESKGEEVRTGERGSSVLPGCCGPHSIRKLAIHRDDELNDEIVNTIPIIGVAAESRTYLLPSHAYEHIRKCRFETLAPWVKAFPSVDCRWVFGICQQRHWTAVAIDWRQGMIQHYDPFTGLSKRAGNIYKAVEKWTQHLNGTGRPGRRWCLEHVHGPSQAADDARNCGVYVAWVLRESMLGRVADAKEFPGPLAFRIEMLHLLRGTLRTSGLPNVGDHLGSPSTTTSREGEGTPAPDKGKNAVTSEGDVKGVVKNVATTPSPKADIQNAKNFRLEAHKRERSIVEASVTERGEQSEHSVTAEAAPHIQNASGTDDCFSSSSPEWATSIEVTPYPGSTSPLSVGTDHHSRDGWPHDLQQGVPRVSDAGLASCEAPAHRHPADSTTRQDHETFTTTDLPLTPFLEEFETLDWPKYLEGLDWDGLLDSP